MLHHLSLSATYTVQASGHLLPWPRVILSSTVATEVTGVRPFSCFREGATTGARTICCALPEVRQGTALCEGLG